MSRGYCRLCRMAEGFTGHARPDRATRWQRHSPYGGDVVTITFILPDAEHAEAVTVKWSECPSIVNALIARQATVYGIEVVMPEGDLLIYDLS